MVYTDFEVFYSGVLLVHYTEKEHDYRHYPYNSPLNPACNK